MNFVWTRETGLQNEEKNPEDNYKHINDRAALVVLLSRFEASKP